MTRIIGAELVRVRSQTTYYVLTRIKGICKVYLDRQRMAEVEAIAKAYADAGADQLAPPFVLLVCSGFVKVAFMELVSFE